MFPPSTELNKRMLKQYLYGKFSLTPALKRAFEEQIIALYWRNKIASSTTNLAEGVYVQEIEVFKIRLSSPDLDEEVLRLIDKSMPYHILYLLEYEGKYQAWLAWKKATKVNRYFHTGWLSWDALPLRLEGLTMDDVYENFLRQIYSLEHTDWNPSLSLEANMELQTRLAKLRREVAALEVKLRNEKQFNRQIDLNRKIKTLKMELDQLIQGHTRTK